MRESVRARNGAAKCLHDPTGKCSRFGVFYPHEERAHGELETVPAARHAQSRRGLQGGRQQRIAAKCLHDHCPIGIQIKDPPDALDDLE